MPPEEVTMVDMARVLGEVVDAFLAALKRRGLEVLGWGQAEDGDVYVKCRLPRSGSTGTETFETNVSNIARDVIFLDRDQPWLGLDARICSVPVLREKVRSVVAQRMGIVEAMMETDEREWRRKLEALAGRSGRLRVWKATEDGELTTTLWYEHGEPVQ